MKYAKITEGAVVQTQPYAGTGLVEVPDGTICGMVDNGDGTFSAPTRSTAEVLSGARAGMAVSRFQARAALHTAGLLADVEAAMQDPATDPIVLIAWQDAVTFRRLSPAVVSIGAALPGMTEAGLDELFRTAATIEV